MRYHEKKQLMQLCFGIMILVVVCFGITTLIVQNKSEKIDVNQEEVLGKIHFNDGNIGAVNTSATEAVLVIERNTGRNNIIITNAGDEVAFLWRKNFTGTTTASAEIMRYEGIPLYPQGTYENWDDEFLWVGDVWVGTTSAPIVITYDEK